MELLEFREKIELPDNWKWTTIDQILDSIESGGRPKGGVKGILEGVPSIGGEHLQHSGGFDFSNIRYIPIEFFKKLSKGKIKNSDVLVVKDGATTGKTSFVSESFPFINAAVNEHVFILRPDKNKVKPKFLFFWMQSQFGQNCVAANFKGTAQGGITTDFTKNSPFPLVPINDQINIISKIEELFTQLDAAEAALKRAKNNLKRYKQSLLQAAVTGELTREWREAHKDELEPASKQLEKIKAERKAKWEAEIRAKGKDPAKEKYKEPSPPDTSDLPELPNGWCWVRISQIADHRLGKMLDKDKNQGQLLPYLRNANVQWFNFDLSDLKSIKIKKEELENVSIKKGDLIICEGGEPGRSAIWNYDYPIVIQKALHRVRFQSQIIPKFVNYHIANDAHIGRLEKYFTGSTIKHFTGESLSKYVLAFPTYIEQREIIELFEYNFSKINQADFVVACAIKKIKYLRNSILTKAFLGLL